MLIVFAVCMGLFGAALFIAKRYVYPESSHPTFEVKTPVSPPIRSEPKLVSKIDAKTIDLSEERTLTRHLAGAQRVEESGNIPEAAILYQEALDFAAHRYGPESHQAALCHYELGVMQSKQGLLEDAAYQFETARQIDLKAQAVATRYTILLVERLIPIREVLGRTKDLSILGNDLKEAVKVSPRLGVADFGEAMLVAARTLRLEGKFDEAQEEAWKALRVFIESKQPDTLAALECYDELGTLFLTRKKYSESKRFLEVALPMYERIGRGSTMALVAFHTKCALVFEALNEHERSRDQITKALRELNSEKLTESRLHRAILVDLSQGLTIHHKAKEAEPLARRALEIANAHADPDGLNTIAGSVALGFCLVEQGKFDEAEPLLSRCQLFQKGHSENGLPSLAFAEIQLAELRRHQHRESEALELAKHATPILVDRLGELHPFTQIGQKLLAALEESEGKKPAASAGSGR
jgi:tetratricopeptide (TPR) repeat protein